MALYRKKPIVIEARVYCGCQPEAIMKWSGARFIEYNTDQRDPEDPNHFVKASALAIRTLEGDMVIAEGDYVIKGIAGEFYPCKPDIFEATYELVSP